MIGSLIMGAMVGWIAGKLMNLEGGLLRNIVVGVIGSFVGSLVFGLVGFSAHGLFANLVVGIVGAIVYPMDDITGFLYLIGSVFAPMVAVQIADHFLLKRDRFDVNFDLRNLVIWLIGFIAYRLLMNVDIVVGYTLPDMLLTVALCLAANKLMGGRQTAEKT